MLHMESESGIDVIFPVLEGLIGKTVHQVHAYVLDASVSEPLDGKGNLGGGMSAMQETQSFVVEGLRTHADSIDAEL